MAVASALFGAVWKCLARWGRSHRLLLTLGVVALLEALRWRSQEENPTFDAYSIITDKEYYAMPQRYELDEYYGCLVRGGVYCFGLFQLEAPPGNELFHMIQLYVLDEYYGCLVHGGVYCFGLFQLVAPPGNELFHMIQLYVLDEYNGCLMRGGVYCFGLFRLEAPPGNELFHMRQLYELDEYYGCLMRDGVYCFGLFRLEAPPGNELFHMMQKYSKDWIWRSNHSLIHRGVCLPRRCPREEHQDLEDHEWFASCVNSSMLSEYNMSAGLTQLEYCTREPQGGRLTAAGAAFLALLAVLVIAVIVSTVLHVRLSHERKKDMGWALSWSVLRSLWTLAKPSPRTEPDLRFLDGLRAISMLVLIGLHAGGLSMLQTADTRFYEQSSLWLLSGNLTLMVQVFFIVSSFLMARKVLQQDFVAAKKTFVETMKDRIVRILPSYAFMILYMVTLNEYNASGPMWHWAIDTEVATCRQQWWTHLLFFNNFNTSLKCIGPTWYLAADMQLYAAGLLLTLLLRGRRAVPVLAVLLATAAVFYVYLAYAWNLVPLYALHFPDNVRDEYVGVSTFDVLYQSPWGNAFAALTGLLLAHAHRTIKTSNYDLRSYKVYRFVARWSVPSILVWVVLWPSVHPQPPHRPTRLRYALLTGLTGPVFCLLVAVIMMEILLGGKKCLRRFLTGNVYSVMARLSLPVLLVHFPIARVQLIAQDRPVHLSSFRLIFNMFGVWAMSYAMAAVLALLVEVPTQRLYRELKTRSRAVKTD
ncbi:nose resistant to fluoxetine protein 6-like [Aricia agestis]|uniref:nose resistant to fluoxetine protein 6-like n=1 Tax=Aricia agestis TaxID=91739 RepID=UPI001C20A79E|nr:nose resistant to fluoxetine protein 6-like [Aricia agestis]